MQLLQQLKIKEKSGYQKIRDLISALCFAPIIAHRCMRNLYEQTQYGFMIRFQVVFPLILNNSVYY